MTLTTHHVFLGLGTNLGDRLINLRSALEALSPQVTVIARSPVYQTPPWGFTEQPDFLNQVVQAETALAPSALLGHIKTIERSVGRTATFRWGPREIDIDILLYDDLISSTGKLTIPHPRLHERAFMLAPLADLAPDLQHPLTGKTIRQHLDEIDHSQVVRYDPPQNGDSHGS